jgi:transmembrane sensor
LSHTFNQCYMTDREAHIPDDIVLTVVRMARLAALHQAGLISVAEQEELQHWLQQAPLHQQLLEEMLEPGKLPVLLSSYETVNAAAKDALEQFHRNYMKDSAASETQVRRINSFKRWWVAASVLLIAAAGGYWLLSGLSHRSPKTEKTQATKDIAPGRDGAVLTLADGRQVVLDSLNNGVVASEHGATVLLSNGELTYEVPAASEETGPRAFNTMATPKGRQFKLKLPDGTEVWLNAASSITYPTVFAASERKVTITGEVFFEVKEDKEKPFMVDIDGRATVEVLGTKFNINAYTNEPELNTTLVQGSIRMLHNGKSAMLKPGQQSRISSTGMKLTEQADIETVMAWRNGLFRFHNDPLDLVLRQLSRWYNLEIKYEQGVPDILFSGEIKRDLTLSQSLDMLSEMGVHFRIEERTLIVLP